MEVKDWIARELAAAEALLAGAPPSCQIDPQRASSAGAKQVEADNARVLLASDQGIARDPAWRAYSTGVLTAFEEVQQQLASSGR